MTGTTPSDPPASPADTVAFLLSQLGFQAAAGFWERLAPLGLEPRHAGVLRVISGGEGQTQHALSEAAGIPASRMVGLVDEVEALGLVERRVKRDDRRARTLHLTPKGRRMVAKVRELGLEHEQSLCAPLNASERKQLLALLRRVADGQNLKADLHPALTKAVFRTRR